MNEPQPRLRDQLLDRAAAIAHHPVVQAGVSALSVLELVHPGLGTAATTAGAALTSTLGAHMDRQAKVALEAVRARVAGLEDRGTLDEERLRHEADETSTFVKAFLVAAQDHAEKIDSYADLLAGLVSTERPTEALDSAVLLSCVSRLEASTLGLARHMCDIFYRDQWAVASGIERPDWGPDTDFHLQHLEAEGLIHSIVEQMTNLGSNPQTSVYRYGLTPTLHRLIATLEAGRAGLPAGQVRGGAEPPTG